jgi:hypothetical protein
MADGNWSLVSCVFLSCRIVLNSPIGQIVIDKRGNGGLNLAALHVAMHMAHEQSFYYSLSGGDKVRLCNISARLGAYHQHRILS